MSSQVNIKTYYGTIESVPLTSSQKIKDIKKVLSEKTNIPISNQIILVDGQVTQDGQSLGAFNITNKSNITLEEKGMVPTYAIGSFINYNNISEVPNKYRSPDPKDKIQYTLTPNIDQFIKERLGIKQELTTVTSELSKDIETNAYWANLGNTAYFNWHRGAFEDKEKYKYFLTMVIGEKKDQALARLYGALLFVGIATGTGAVTGAAGESYAYLMSGIGKLNPFNLLAGVNNATNEAVNNATNAAVNATANEAVNATATTVGGLSFMSIALTALGAATGVPTGILQIVMRLFGLVNAPIVTALAGTGLIAIEIKRRTDGNKAMLPQIFSGFINWIKSNPLSFIGNYINRNVFGQTPANVNTIENILIQNNPFKSPFEMADDQDKALEFTRKLGRNVTTDDLFLVYGTTLDRPIVRVWPTTEEDLTKMQTDGLITITMDDSKYGPRYFPSQYYSLGYLINKIDNNKNVYSLPSNYVITLVNNGQVAEQFLKLFDDIDLWIGLEPPNRRYYSEKAPNEFNKSKWENRFVDPVIFRIGPQNFTLRPLKFPGGGPESWIWDANAEDFSLVVNNGVLYNIDDFLVKQRFWDKESHDRVGAFIALPFKFPTLKVNTFEDYYLKVKKDSKFNWVRISKPLFDFEDTKVGFRYQSQNIDYNFELISDKIQEVSTIEMSDSEIRLNGSSIIQASETLYRQLVSFFEKYNDEPYIAQAFYTTGTATAGVLAAQKVYSATGNLSTSMNSYQQSIAKWRSSVTDTNNDLSTNDLISLTQLISSSVVELTKSTLGIITGLPVVPGSPLPNDFMSEFYSIYDNAVILEGNSLKLMGLTSNQKRDNIHYIQNNYADYNTTVVPVYLTPLLNSYNALNGTPSLITYNITPQNMRDILQRIDSIRDQRSINIFTEFFNTANQITVAPNNVTPDEEPLIKRCTELLSQLYDKYLEMLTVSKSLIKLIEQLKQIFIVNNGNAAWLASPLLGLYNSIYAFHNQVLSVAIFNIKRRIIDEQPNENINITGLNWIKNTFTLKGSNVIVTSTGTVKLATSEAQKQLAAAQIIFKSEGVLMMEALIAHLQNPFKAPISWLEKIPTPSAFNFPFGKKSLFGGPIRWYVVKGDQEKIKGVIVKFIDDEKTNNQLIIKGIQKLVETVHPTSSKWSRTVGTWTTAHQTTLVKQFLNDIRASTDDIQTIVSQVPQTPQAPQPAQTPQAPQSPQATQQGGADGDIDETMYIDTSKPYIIDMGKVPDAVDKLLAVLMSKDALEKEENSASNDPLTSDPVGNELYKNVLEPLMRLSLSERIRWMRNSSNQLTVQLLLEKFWNANKRELFDSSLDTLIRLFEPTGVYKLGKRGSEFKAINIRENFMKTADSGNIKTAINNLIEALLLEKIESATSSTNEEDQKAQSLLDEHQLRLSKFIDDVKSSLDRLKPLINDTYDSWKKQQEYRKEFDAIRKKCFDEFTTLLSSLKQLPESKKIDWGKKHAEMRENMKVRFEEVIKEFEKQIEYNKYLKRTGLSPTSNSYDDWKRRMFPSSYTTPYANYPRTSFAQTYGQPPTQRPFSGIFGRPSQQTPSTTSPFSSQSSTLYRPSESNNLLRQATRPGFATYIDPSNNQPVTMNISSSSDYARIQQAVATLDPAKVSQFMSKLGDIAASLPADQASVILEQMQRRVLNELDKYCIRQGNWQLFDEQTNKCN